MKKQRTAQCLGLLLLVVLVTAPQFALAQQTMMPADCGITCRECMVIGWTGDMESEFNRFYLVSCLLMVGCPDCEGTGLVKGAGPEATDILETVLAAELTGLPGVLDQYGDRLVLHPSRNLLAVRGANTCGQALRAVMFLPSEKAMALEQLGVRLMEDFLADAGHAGS